MENGSQKQSKAQKVFMEWTLDVLIYVTVLNVFVHYVDGFFVENFMYSIAAAFVLKATLVVILRFEHSVSEWFGNQDNKFYKVIRPLAIWGILFGSKFLILEVIDFVFGKKVDLHNFIALIFMVIVMIFFREVLNKIYNKLGD